MDNRNKCLLALGTLLSASSLAAPPQSLDTFVVTTTRSETPVSAIAGNTGLVSDEEIELIRPTHISELLDRIPGVYIHRNNGQELLTSIRSPVFTGSSAAASFLFMEDGIALRAAPFSNTNGLSEANAEQAGSIEVVRGPGSAFYGSNALFGLVNVISRTPSSDPEKIIDFSAGPHGLSAIKTTFSGTHEQHGYRLSFNALHDGGYRDDSGFDQQKLTLRHDYENVESRVKTVLSAFNLNQETAGFITSKTDDEIYKDIGTATTNPNPEAFRDWKSVRLSSGWTTTLANGNQLTLTPYLRDNKMRFLRHFVPEQSIEKNGHTSLGLQSAYAMAIAEKHKLVTGIDLDFSRGWLEDTQERADFGGFGKFRPQGKHYDYEVDSFSIAPYLHSEWAVNDKTRLIAGVRFEHTRYDYDNKMIAGTSKDDGSTCTLSPGCEYLFLRPADRTDIFNNISPKLGAIYVLNEFNSFYLNLSRGFRAPQVSELYQLQNKQTVGEIDSEQLDSIEIGAKGIIQGVRYDIALYHMKRKEFFFRDADGLNVTDGKSKHSGVEVSISSPLTGTTDLAVSYNYGRHKYDFDRPANGIMKNNDIDTAPRHTGNIRLGWDYLPGGRAELEWILVGRYYTDPSNAHEYDGHDLVNLRSEQQLNSQTKLFAQITNLTDTRYAERADFAFGSHRFFPGERRALHVGIQFDL